MKRNSLRILCLLLSFLLFSGCTPEGADLPDSSVTQSSSSESDTAPQEKPTAQNTVYRLYYDSSDSFHPFLAKTQTQYNLFSLMYDGLFCITPEYGIESRVAASYKISGNHYRIDLAKVSFSDGTKVTAEDVKYSFDLAKREGSLYAAQLADAESCEIDGNTVVITLKKRSRYFVYALDFPIIKSGTGNTPSPIGCGRYRLKKDGNSYRMVQNTHHTNTKALPDIELVVLQSNDSMLYAVKTGTVTAYQENSLSGNTSTVGTWTTSISLNHLVFVGVNPNKPLLSDVQLRKAIMTAIDNNAVLSQAYGSQGVITKTPVHPQLTDNMQYDFSSKGVFDAELAKQLLDEAGFLVSDAGIRTNARGQQLTVSIMVNRNNSARYSAAYLISGMLEAVGFEVSIERVSFGEYTERIASGDFDLYIGETAQRYDCSMDVFLTGDASFGLQNSGFSQAIEPFLEAEKGEKAFFDAIFDEVPMIPLLYRNGQVIYSKNVENKVITAPHDIFYNIADWL